MRSIPRERHLVETWNGERISLSTYTVRGEAYLNDYEHDFLRSVGFPRNGDPGQALRRPNQPSDNQEGRPKKSVRKQLWKRAAQASALIATSLAANVSYGIEYAPEINLDAVGLLESGDYTQVRPGGPAPY